MFLSARMVSELVRRYGGLLRRGDRLADAACVSWVRDLDPAEVLRRLGGVEPFAARTVDEVDRAMLDLYDVKDEPGRRLEPVAALCDRLDATWCLLVEPNGWAATFAADLAALSAGTEVISMFWNINGVTELSVARDGMPAAVLDDVAVDYLASGRAAIDDVEGNAPSLVENLLHQLADVQDYTWQPVAFAWIERYTGARLPAGWLDQPHPSAVFAKCRGA
jgi:Family of unknown function (DUF6461)